MNEYIGTALVGVVVLAILILITRNLLKKKLSKSGTCCGDCGSCGGCH